MWVWVLGVVSYYSIPSLGTFESAPELLALVCERLERTGNAELERLPPVAQLVDHLQLRALHARQQRPGQGVNLG